MEFVDGALYENHENWYPTKIRPSTVVLVIRYTMLYNVLYDCFFFVYHNYFGNIDL